MRQMPRLITFDSDDTVGWIEIDLRLAFAHLASSQTLKPVDDQEAGGISYILIGKRGRCQGLAVKHIDCGIGLDKGSGENTPK